MRLAHPEVQAAYSNLKWLLLEVLVSQSPHSRGPGGTVDWVTIVELRAEAMTSPGHYSLTVWSDVQKNLLDLRLKAHVQHPISFIQHLTHKSGRVLVVASEHH